LPDLIDINMAKKKKEPTQPKAKAHPPTGPMDPLLLERLIKLMRENDVNALEVSEGANRISLQRGATLVAAAPQVVHAATPVAVPAPAAKADAPRPDDDAGLRPIKSPMVGTFYSKPSPDAKPFVSVGTVVDEDKDVCIIEAMKVFNNIKAEVRGTIAKVCVNEGQSVEFGTVLFLVK
jgi:acetyl-CoA carboxylase biotin carboxyl carrier protein